MPVSDLNNVQLDWFRGMDANGLIQSDFTEPFPFTTGVQAIAAGAGAGIFGTGLGTTAGHPGIFQLNTGFTATGRVFVLSRVNSYTVGVGGITKAAAWVSFPFLSTALERFTARTAFFNIALPNLVVTGIGFEYNDAENGGRWQAITDDGVQTSTDTGVAVVAGDWYKLELEINADGTEVNFSINDEPVARNTTNIPSGPGISHFANMHIMKLIGVSARNMLLDAYAIYQDTGGRE
jgi:hypothetical protein